MMVALGNSGAYISATQTASDGAWGQFGTVVLVQGLSIVSDLASDIAGNVTFVYEAIGFSTSQAYVVSGSISDNTWSAPVLLSGNDMSVGQVYFALASNGAGLVAWLESSATPVVHAVTRTSTAGTWSSPTAVSVAGSTEIGPEAAAVNASGDAIVIYSGYNSSDVHTEYVSNYTP
jgi:hypothetical protein